MAQRIIGLLAAASFAVMAPTAYAHHKVGHIDAGAGNGSEYALVTVCTKTPRGEVCESVCVELDPGMSGAHNQSPELGVNPKRPPEECNIKK